MCTCLRACSSLARLTSLRLSSLSRTCGSLAKLVGLRPTRAAHGLRPLAPRCARSLLAGLPPKTQSCESVTEGRFDLNKLHLPAPYYRGTGAYMFSTLRLKSCASPRLARGARGPAAHSRRSRAAPARPSLRPLAPRWPTPQNTILRVCH